MLAAGAVSNPAYVAAAQLTNQKDYVREMLQPIGETNVIDEALLKVDENAGNIGLLGAYLAVDADVRDPEAVEFKRGADGNPDAKGGEADQAWMADAIRPQGDHFIEQKLLVGKPGARGADAVQDNAVGDGVQGVDLLADALRPQGEHFIDEKLLVGKPGVRGADAVQDNAVGDGVQGADLLADALRPQGEHFIDEKLLVGKPDDKAGEENAGGGGLLGAYLVSGQGDLLVEPLLGALDDAGGDGPAKAPPVENRVAGGAQPPKGEEGTQSLAVQQKVVGEEEAPAAAQNPALRRQVYADALAYLGRAATRFEAGLFDELGQAGGRAEGDASGWVSLVGTADRVKGSGERHGSKARSQGVSAGVALQAGDGLALGAAVGQTAGKINSDGKARLDLTQVGVAAIQRLDDQAHGPYVGIGLGAAHASIHAKRSFEGKTDKGKTSADQYHASFKLGSDIELGAWMVEPSLGLTALQTHLKGTREKDEGLRIKSQNQSTALAHAGLNLSRNFQLAGWTLKPELSGYYQHRMKGADSVKLVYGDEDAGVSWRQLGASSQRGSGGAGLGLEVRRDPMRAQAEVTDDGSVNLNLGVSW